MDLDPQSASIPWELIETQDASGYLRPLGERDTPSASAVPWAIQVKLLRKLRLREFRESVNDATTDASVLVIGEPECPREYPRLFGAHARRSRSAPVCRTRSAIHRSEPSSATIPADVGPNAREVINALFERPWRVVHIAGHGEMAAAGQPGGVVLSENTFPGSGRDSQHANGAWPGVRELLSPRRALTPANC